MMNWSLWELNPALLYGLTLLCGCLFALSSPLALVGLILLILTAYNRLLILILLFLLPLPWLHLSPPKNEGRFHIQQMAQNYGWIYRGTLNHRPVTVRSSTYYIPSHDYYLKGSWKNETQFEANTWEKLSIPSLTHFRLTLQKGFKRLLLSRFKYEDGALFLTGMLTGDLEKGELKKRCQTLGLSHLLAVSGFHFGVLYFGFHLLLRPLMSRKVTLIVLGIVMTCYALFVGFAPSTQRAWIFMIVYIIGELIERSSPPLNTLGGAMLISLLLNPFSCLSLSFQLSFMATGGILLFYPPIHQWFHSPLPLYRIATTRPVWWGLGYHLSQIISGLCSLTLAVHLVSLPLVFYHFHLFYPHSLFYNLFFPLLASFSIFLLPIYPLSDFYTHALLWLVYHPPILFSPITCRLSGWGMTILIAGILFWGCYREEKKLNRKNFRAA